MIRPPIVYRAMPKNYARHPEAGHLPEEAPVWLVQNSGKEYSGAVSAAYNFEGLPDDELLVAGCNAKAYPHAAIGRQGNILQWGYGEPPSSMTEDGRRLFVNCICYIKRFAGQPPLVRQAAMNRRWALHYKAFSPDLDKDYKGREGELYALYKDNFELLYHERRKDNYIVFLIDFQLKESGIESNRRISTLEQLIALLPDEDSSQGPQVEGFFQRIKNKRQRRQVSQSAALLRQYTDEDFGTKKEWQAWLDANRERIYFTDFGGYKFGVMPADRAAKAQASSEEPFWFPQ